MAENQDGLDLSALHTAFTDWRGLDAFLQELTERAVRAVGGADACSVTMHRDGRLVSAAGSDGEALKLDSLQYEADAGPCVCSLRDGREQYVRDMTTEQRWPPYPEKARTYGIRSVLAAPLKVNSGTLGALNLYAHEPYAFEEHAPSIGRLADQAAGAVAVAARIEEERTTVEDLRAAMFSRSVIDQAIGIVMARRNCPEDEALSTLRKASQHRNIKLRDLCRELVHHTGGTPPSPGSFARRK
ncbi:GAF and ANTAR domain-containing protein [Streptomyces sp. NBC_01465]|uniref:GAF and ANTAR domain-containing protein n=1 Tax=Streptomyces sp. NBC_01465 TaxID=2903878 RepID=UPI002E318F87|nr:GAF and ANTAR domain-containing protein [Streptomyces sp. NBC_01465]